MVHPWAVSAAKRQKGNPKGQGKGQGGGGRGGNGGYVHKLKGGATICKDWNMGRCRTPCNKKDDLGKTKVHVCNWEMPDGSACGMSDHTSGEHPKRFG